MTRDYPTPAERVVALVQTLAEARVSYALASTGEGPILMPSMYHDGSYAELERALARMRDGSQPLRSWWWHLNHRYRWGSERLELLPVLREQLGPRVLVPNRCELSSAVISFQGSRALVRVRRWDQRVDHAMVALALDELVETMYGGDSDRITLPKVILQRWQGSEPYQMVRSDSESGGSASVGSGG